MNRAFVAAAALLAGIAIAAPLAWSADEPQTGQSMPGIMGDMHEHHAMHPMRQHGGMHETMMHRMMHGSPQQRCEEGLARRAAVVAYTGSRLKLSAEQRPLWDKLNATLQSVRDKRQQFCDSLKQDGDRPQITVIERMNRTEQLLSTRLDALHQVRPALEDLYRALTPEQKSVIDRIGMRG